MRKLGCLLLSLLLLTGCIRTTSPSPEEIKLPADISSEISDEAADSPTEDDLPAQPDDQPQQASFLRLAYLPVNAVPAQTDSLLSDYREQLAALDAVILNTGVYWNLDGELAISSEWLQTVQTLQPTIDLWRTAHEASFHARGQDALAGALSAAASSVRAGSGYTGVCGRFRQYHGL